MSKNVTNDGELVAIPGLGNQLHQELLLNYFLPADIDMSLSTYISRLLLQNNIRIFLIILSIILVVAFNSNSSEGFRPLRYFVLDNQTGFVVVSGSGYIQTENGRSSVFKNSVMLIRPTVMSACSQAIPRISDSHTASDSEVASWSSLITTAILSIRQWIGFRNYDEPSTDSKVPVQQWVLLLNISQLERSNCKLEKLFESISTAGYSAIILPVRYQKTFKQIKSVWRRGLVKTQDLLIIHPSHGQELFKYTGTTSSKWFTWGNAEKSIKIVLQMETINASAIHKDVFPRGIWNVTNIGECLKTSIYHLINTSYNALPDLSGGMMALKDLGKSVRTGYNKLIRTFHNALPDFSGGIIVLEDIGKSFRTGCNKLISTFHNALPDFPKWTNSIFELTTSSKLHQLAEKFKPNLTHFVEFVLSKMQQVKAYAQDSYDEEFPVCLNYKAYELQRFEKCMFERFDSHKTVEMCIQDVRRAYRQFALKTHPDKAERKGVLFDELNNQQFIKSQESKDYLLRKCKERVAKS